MFAEKLKSLLDSKNMVPGKVPELAELCEQWFIEEPSALTFILVSLMQKLNRGLDTNQGVPRTVYEVYENRLLPKLQALANYLVAGNGEVSISLLDELSRTFRDCQRLAGKTSTD